MLERLTNDEALDKAARAISALISAHAEWFITQNDGHTSAVQQRELELTLSHGNLILSSWTEKGIRSWRIKAWDWSGAKLLLQTTRRMGAERTLLELVPRASAGAIAATVKAARQRRCDQLAQLAAALQFGARVERATLSPGLRRGQPGRYARIILRQKHERIAVTGTVAATNSGWCSKKT